MYVAKAPVRTTDNISPNIINPKYPFAAATTPMTLSKLIMISANNTFPMLLMYEGSLPFLVVGFTFLISSKSFLKSLTIQIKRRPPRILIK